VGRFGLCYGPFWLYDGPFWTIFLDIKIFGAVLVGAVLAMGRFGIDPCVTVPCVYYRAARCAALVDTYKFANMLAAKSLPAGKLCPAMAVYLCLYHGLLLPACLPPPPQSMSANNSLTLDVDRGVDLYIACWPCGGRLKRSRTIQRGLCHLSV